MDLLATADAIAGRFTGITATVDGVTRSLVACTARLPNDLGQGPAIVVFPPSGDVSIGVSRRRYDTLDFPVRLLVDPVDYPTRTAWLYAWANAMRDRVEMDMDLGLAYVAWAMAVGLSINVVGDGDTMRYGALEYDVVELTVRVRFDEVVTSVAP